MIQAYINTLKRVFSTSTYNLVGILIAVLFFLLFLGISQITIIGEVASIEGAFFGKASLIWTILYTSFTQMSGGGVAYLIILSLLVGLQGTLLVFLIKQRATTLGALSRGIWGMVLGMVGIGCSACGSVLFVTILSLFIGTGNALALFTQWGLVIGIGGIGVLLYAIFFTLRMIEKPAVCR